MNTHKLFRSLLFACLGIVLAACANVQTQPTALATDTTAPTATVAIATATLVSTETPTLATAEAPQIPPDILTAIDLIDARDKILPYCKVHSDLSETSAVAQKVFDSIPTIHELWKIIEARMKNHEIIGYGGNILAQKDGSGGCILVVTGKNETTFASVFFESRFNGSWVEVKLTGKK
jgi:hypothetical protein